MRIIALGSAVLLALCAIPWLLPPWTCNHDVGWFLHVAGCLLDGDRLYVDVIDVNPPLIVYLSVIPIALARALGVSEILAFHAFVFLAIAVSVAATATALAKLELPLSRAGRALGLWAMIYILAIAPAADFGQREHLMVILILPWVAVAAARACRHSIPLPLALLAGVMAGLGFGLKPYFTLAPALVVVWILIRGGRRSVLTPENAALAGVLAIYAAHFAVLPREVAAGMIHTLETARATYAGYDMPLATMLTQPLVVQAALLGCALALMPTRGDARSLCVVLGWIWLGLLAAALWQHKGWSYHFVGVASAGRLLLAITALALIARRSPAWTAAVAFALTALTAGALLERHGGGVRWEKPHRAWLTHVEQVQALADGGPVLALDTDIAPYYPILNVTGLPATSRLACLWPLPGLRQTDHGTGERIERELRDGLIQDFARRPPQLVIVGLPPLFMMEPTFDLLAWLQLDPRFARSWEDYEHVLSVDGRAFFRRRP